MRLILSSLLCLIFSNAFTQISLDSCQSLAKENYPAIVQYQLLELSEDYNLKSVSSNYLPKLNITAIGGYLYGLPSLPGTDDNGNDQFIALTQLNQLIWDGGISKKQKEMISSNTKLRQFELDDVFQKLNQKITSIYFSIILLDEKTQTLESLDSTYQTQLLKLNSAVQNGTVLASESNQLEIAIIQNQQRRNEANLMRDQYLGMLALFTGRTYGSATKLSIPSEVQLGNKNTNRNPRLAMLDEEMKKVTIEKQLLKSNVYPKFGLTGVLVNFLPELSLGPANSDIIALAGISASWNIDGLWSNKNKKSTYDVQTKILQSRKEQLEFQLDLDLSMHKMEIDRYQNRYKESEKITVLKEKIAKSYQSRYDNQNIGISELLKVLEDLRMSKSEMQTNYLLYLQAIYNYNQILGNTY